MGTDNVKRMKTKEKNRRKIMEAALKCFSKNDFHEISVDEIAEEAGFSKGTLYLYFKNKEDLFFSVIKDKSADMLELLENTLSKKTVFRESLELFVGAMLGFFREHKMFFRIVHSEKSRMTMETHYKFHDWAQQVNENFLELIKTLVRKGEEEGTMRDVEVMAAAKCLRGMMNSYIFQSSFWGVKESLDNEVSQIVDIFLNGISCNN